MRRVRGGSAGAPEVRRGVGVAALGELCIWAALPLAALSAAASLAGAWTRRGDLGALGGRAAEAASALLLIAVSGLIWALVTVQLEYLYVASHSGFQQPWYWRVAGLWSGGAGGVLFLSSLIIGAAALSYRLGPWREGVTRTGCLAALGAVSILVTLRSAPFHQRLAPALAGAGLPQAIESLPWQIETVAVYLAIAASAFALAGLVAEEFVGTQTAGRAERLAVVLVAGLLSVALISGSWRAYSETGELFNVEGASRVAVHVPAWLLAFAFLHAPGGPVAPAWALRWRRIFAVALFPAVLGDLAATLSAWGGVPASVPWAGGLAAGVLAGALVGAARTRGRWAGLEDVPGFGAGAIAGGLLCLGCAGLMAAWGLMANRLWLAIGWAVALLALGSFGAFTLVLGTEVGRWRRASRAPGVPGTAASDVGRRVVASRVSRRRASLISHLGLTLAVVGLFAGGLTQHETQMLAPGQTLTLRAGYAPAVRVTYLGLSRYQVGELDKQVASFKFASGARARGLVTASLVFDWESRQQLRRPAIRHGALADAIVSIVGLQANEAIMCRVSLRPLAGLVWLGGLLLLLGTVLARRTAWSPR